MGDFAVAILAVALAGGLLFGVGALPLVLHDLWVRSRWRKAAQTLGYSWIPGPLMGSDQMHAQLAGGTLTIESERRRRTKLRLDARSRVPRHTMIQRRVFEIFLRDAPPPLRTGDEVFDAAIKVEGGRAWLTASLDRVTRARVRQLFEADASLQLVDGVVFCSSERLITRIGGLRRISVLASTLVDAIAFAESLVQKLAANARDPAEPLPFRLINLEALGDRYQSEPELVTNVLREKMSGGHVSERLVASSFLVITEGTESAAALTFEKVLADKRVEPDLRQRALGRVLARAEKVDALLPAFVGMTSPEEPEALCLELTRFFRGLGRGRPTAEKALVRLLHHPSSEVRLAAAVALGDVGSVDSVAPLLEAADASRIDLKMRRAAKVSVAAIQELLPKAERGTLSMSGDDGEASGALSLDAPARGALSETKPGEES